jgi:hypothetical protein
MLIAARLHAPGHHGDPAPPAAGRAAADPVQSAEVRFWRRTAGQAARVAPGGDRYGSSVLAASARPVAAALTCPDGGWPPARPPFRAQLLNSR